MFRTVVVSARSSGRRSGLLFLRKGVDQHNRMAQGLLPSSSPLSSPASSRFFASETPLGRSRSYHPRDGHPPKQASETSRVNSTSSVSKSPASSLSSSHGIQLSKFIANTGICSRRIAEGLIGSGRVTLNGSPVTSRSVRVEKDQLIEVDGHPIPKQPLPKLWTYYKETLVEVTSNPEENRRQISSKPTISREGKKGKTPPPQPPLQPSNIRSLSTVLNLKSSVNNATNTTGRSIGKETTIYKLQRDGKMVKLSSSSAGATMLPPHVIPVGRLDVMSEGLMLLTNNGHLSSFLENPDSRIPRSYWVRVHGVVNESKLRALRRGMTVGEETYAPLNAAVLSGNPRGLSRGKTSGLRLIDDWEVKTSSSSKNVWLDLTLYEGKNREIRNLMKHLHLDISKLIRYQFGPYTLAQNSLPVAGGSNSSEGGGGGGGGRPFVTPIQMGELCGVSIHPSLKRHPALPETLDYMKQR